MHAEGYAEGHAEGDAEGRSEGLLWVDNRIFCMFFRQRTNEAGARGGVYYAVISSYYASASNILHSSTTV